MEPAKKNKNNIKAMNTSRRSIKKRQPSIQLQRLKSQQQPQQITTIQNKTIVPNIKRPSSVKHTDTTNSLTSTSSIPSENQIKNLISQCLCYSAKIKQFLKDRNLSESTTKDKLLENELFTLSLIKVVGGKSDEDVSTAIEESIIRKIKRMQDYETQIFKCQKTQNKITKLIEDRLNSLNYMSKN